MSLLVFCAGLVVGILVGVFIGVFVVSLLAVNGERA